LNPDATADEAADEEYFARDTLTDLSGDFLIRIVGDNDDMATREDEFTMEVLIFESSISTSLTKLEVTCP